ncbi:MAG: fumarylacetoacetate hydrolase family protein [Planctomycetota bacterium]
MHLVRFRCGKDVCHGIAQDTQLTAARVIVGDLFGDYSITDDVLPVEQLLAPIVPTDILCIGLNYRAHAEETGSAVPENPMLFIKASNALNDPGAVIPMPTRTRTHMVDYEAELAVVIGKDCKDVSAADALDYVFGYTAANDVSARDWQKDKKLGGGQFARGKSFDGFCPLGPCIATRDEIADPNDLAIRCTLNGAVMQESNTSDMIFDVRTLIESLSSTMTLRQGSVLLTGTPPGVGMAREPQVWLKAGDEVVVEVEGVGKLVNSVG